jgi:hypothetical protein
MLEKLKMTEFQPKPQTPEQVADGLRNAFRQAMKDGVMDATPYLKQMTFNTDIEKTEAEIKVLQAKLELLKEIETHKSQPRMNLQYTVKGEVVSYNDEVYYRLDFAGMNHNWYKKKTDNGVILVKITDGETHRLLEGVWFNDVKKGKYDDVVDEHKSPVAEAYKDWWGQYPELETDSEYDEMRWQGFQAGYEAGQVKAVPPDEPYCPDEPLEYDEVEHDISENVENKTIRQVIDRWWMDTFTSKNMWSVNECIDDLADQIEFWILRNNKKVLTEEPTKPRSPLDEIVDKLIKERQAQKLWNIMRDKLGFSIDMCDEIVDAVEEWLPDQQSAAGSQNVDVELLVDGFNDCLRKMKEMLR